MLKRKTYTEEQVAEIEAARAKNKDKNVERRLFAVLLYAQGASREEIKQRTGYAINYITDLAKKYRDKGLGALVDNHHTGNHRNMSREEEALFLKGFEERAAAGEMIDVREIKEAYEKKVGRATKSRGHIYTLLARNDWRKVMPRGKHPNQASEEEIALAKNKIHCGEGVQ
jgi:transposase